MAVVKKKLPKSTKVFETYWKFATLRQDVFFKRLQGQDDPWTTDKILLRHKFTNAYRASDRVSQYLINRVIYSGSEKEEEVFFRIILFKLFNKIETWELLTNALGPLSYSTFKFETYEKVLSKALVAKKRIYSAAYIMASGSSRFGYSRKHKNHLRLLEMMMTEGLPTKVSKAKSLEEVFRLLLSYPTIGRFLAYQYAIDLNYSNLTNFDENDFVMPGPGALDGLKKCFSDWGDYSEADLIKLTTEMQQSEFKRLGLDFKNLWGRPLKLIDCQNLFCEVDKYSRVAHPEFLGQSGRTRIKQMFKPNFERVEYAYPPKWSINHLISGDRQRAKQ